MQQTLSFEMDILDWHHFVFAVCCILCSVAREVAIGMFVICIQMVSLIDYTDLLALHHDIYSIQ